MRIMGLVRAMQLRLFDIRGWWMSLLLGALAAALRLPHLGRPDEFSFDETYYAKDAFSYLNFGYERAFVDKANELLLAGSTDVFKATPEFVVHPPLGKWAIALGVHFFGMNPFGWRIVMAVLGVAAVVVLHRVSLRLTGNVYTAALAGLFMAIDGLAIVLSRTALLDATLMFFVLCTFHALVRDRDHYEHSLALRAYNDSVPWQRRLRPWRLTAIVWITCAMATKWSALWFALGFAMLALAWDLLARRRHGLPRGSAWLTDVGWVLAASVIGTVGYIASWIGWFRSVDAWERTVTEGPQWLPQALRALLHYHQQALHFHVTLTSAHPYKAAPYWWLLMVRPTSFSYNSYGNGKAGCAADSCAAEVLALGNVVIWWTAVLVILALLFAGVARLLRMRVELLGTMHDFTVRSRIRWDATGGPLVGIAAGWLPWMYWHERTTFTFYAIVITPFMCMLAAQGLTLFATHRVAAPLEPAPSTEDERSALFEALAEGSSYAPAADTYASEELVGAVDVSTAVSTSVVEFEDVHERRFLIAVLVVAMAIGFSIFFYPVWVGQVLPYSSWHARMWLPSWV